MPAKKPVTVSSAGKMQINSVWEKKAGSSYLSQKAMTYF